MTSLHLRESQAAPATEVDVDEAGGADKKKIGPRLTRVIDLETSMRYMKSKGRLFHGHQGGGGVMDHHRLH